MNVTETFEHNPEHPAFSNFETKTPARYKLNPEHEEEHEHLKRLHGNYSWADQQALGDYTASSQNLNLKLANGGHGTYTENAAKTVSTSIQNNKPLEHDHHVYSGLGAFHPGAILNHKDGKFQNKHFISASIDPEVATGHDNLKNMLHGTDHSHIVHFHLPKGYDKGRYIAPVSEFAGEHEFLLDRDQKWQVHNSETIHSKHPLSGHAMSKTIWSVKPHVENVKEELEHHGKEYFDDIHPDLNFMDWDKKQNQYHPNPAQLEDHIADLTHRVNIKTAALKPSEVDADSGLSTGLSAEARKMMGNHVQRFHKAIGQYSRGSTNYNDHLINKGSPDYTLNQYKALNKETVDDTIAKVSDGISKLSTPVKHTIHTYSGTNHPELLNMKMQIGDVFHTPAFTSTSIKHNVAKGFGWNKVDPDSSEAAHHIIHFELPAGYNKGAYIKPHSWLPHEHEYLLDKDQHWKITKHEVFKTRDPESPHNREKVIDRHVWTVVPHKPKKNILGQLVKEALVHIPALFGNKHPGLAKYSRTYNKMYEIFNNRDALQRHQSIAHEEHIKEHNSYTPSPEEKDKLNYYTRSGSRDINEHILKSPEDKKTEYDYQAGIMANNKEYHAQQVKAGVYEPVPESNWEHPHVKHEKAAHEISNIIEKHSTPLKQESHVYSGVGFNPSEHFNAANGVFHTPAFISTSLGTTTPNSFGKVFYKGTTHDTKLIKPFEHYIQNGNVTKHEQHTITNKSEKHIIHFKLPEGYNKGLYIAPHSNYPEEKEYLLNKDQKWKLENHEVVRDWHTSRYRDTNIDYNTHPYTEQSKKVTNKSYTDRHIWTVVPHDEHSEEKPVTEALVHIPELLANKSFKITKDAKTKVNTQPVADKIKERDEFEKKLTSVHHDHLIQHNSFEPSKGHLTVIRDYTGVASRRLNRYLIENNSESLDKEHHIHMSKSISEAINTYSKPLDVESHMYSGIGFDPSEHFKTANGVFHSPAFISSSISPATAKDFGEGEHNKVVKYKPIIPPIPNQYEPTKTIKTHEIRFGRNERHLLHFKLPVGYNKGLYIAPHSKLKDEHEFLLDKDQKWKLEGHHTVKGSHSYRGQDDMYNKDTDNWEDTQRSDRQLITRHIWTVVPHEP